jgi:sigma-B regulation protein RsbU (phosphoserine phosphatase)
MDTTPLRGLFIEDEPLLALMLQETLAHLAGGPFAVKWADSLAQGLKLLGEGEIDIVLLDLMLPDSSGLKTFRCVRAQAPASILIVVLTGLDDESVGQTALRAGGEDFLLKSRLNTADLGRCLRFALERHQRRRTEEMLEASREEFRTARAIQRRLLPSLPGLRGFDLAGMSYCAGEACGDYFDYIPMRDGRLGIAIGDVSGHGLAPALLIASTRAYLRAFCQTHDDVGEILVLANRVLAEDLKDENYVTLLLACLDPQRRCLVYASAGHPTAYILDRAGMLKARLDSTGVPLSPSSC